MKKHTCLSQTQTPKTSLDSTTSTVMDFSNTTIGRGNHGSPFMVIPQFQSWFGVHPDHVGFVIGSKGATVKKIANDCKCYIKIQDPNAFSGGFPWFIIKGSTEANVCEAYHRLRTIANEAERRMPRLPRETAHGPTPRPRANLNVTKTLPREEEPATTLQPKTVEVVEKRDNDGNVVLVDEETNDVYHPDGRLVGYWKDNTVFARSDESE